jgi:vacuolar-type H+-ATPase subunit H
MSIELLIEEERKSIKQIEDARTKADKKIADSQKEAQKILDQVIKKEFIQKYLQKEEEKVNEEAKKVLNKYKKDVAKIKQIPSNKIQKTVDRIIDEVLKI